MFVWRTSAGLRSLLALAVAMAIGVIGCGDSDDGGGSNDATAASSGTQQTEIGNVMRRMREAFNEADGDGFCAGLTSDGRDEIVRLGVQTPALKAKDCPGIVTKYSKRLLGPSKQQQPVRVRKVTANGDKARVVITGGLAGVRRIVPFRLERVDGVWKLDDPLSGPSRSIGMDYSLQFRSN